MGREAPPAGELAARSPPSVATVGPGGWNPRLIPRRRDGRPWAVLPLQTWLLLTHLVVLFLPLLVVVGTGALGRDLLRQTQEDLEHQGALIAMLASDHLRHARDGDPRADLDSLVWPLSDRLRRTRDLTRSGVQITDARGVVVAASGTLVGEDLSRDPEVAAALAGRPGMVVRPRPPTHAPLGSESRRADVRVFVAVPILLEEELVGAVVLSRTPREELQALYHMAPEGLLAGGGVAVACTLLLSLAAAFVLARSLRIVAGGADRLAAGDRTGLVEMADPEGSHVAEVASVARSVTAMTHRLQERLSYIGEFASNVSHEFKTPLATLRGTLELLDEDDDMPAEQRDRFLANARAEVDRLERLVTGLLALARAEEGGQQEPLDLQELVERVASRYPAAQLVGQAGRAMGNAPQLEAALENLLRNATRYGGPEIVVRAFAEGGSTGFEVRDDGPGISAGNAARVFDRFFTTDRAAGTGLGLAIVRAVARGHGGDVSLVSAPGDTRIAVTLPRLR